MRESRLRIIWMMATTTSDWKLLRKTFKSSIEFLFFHIFFCQNHKKIRQMHVCFDKFVYFLEQVLSAELPDADLHDA